MSEFINTITAVDSTTPTTILYSITPTGTDNQLTTIGQSILLRSAGMVEFENNKTTTIVVAFTGSTATRKYLARYRISYDGGLNFTDWSTQQQTMPFSGTIQYPIIAQIRPQSPIVMEFEIERAGTDTTGTLTVVAIYLGAYATFLETNTAYDNSPLVGLLDIKDPEIWRWSLNILNKLYKTGIVPTYIERGLNRNYNWEDQDFIDFWRAVSFFFSIFVNYIRQLEDFVLDDNLLNKYINQKGLFTAPNQSLADLTYIMNHFYNEVRKRGTSLIILSEANGNDVDGELLRLIKYTTTDEFIFGLLEPEKQGWNIGNSSPCYKGTNRNYSISKNYDSYNGYLDSTKVPELNPAYVSVIVGQLSLVGLGHSLDTGFYDTGTVSKRRLIDPRIDYEITFRFLWGGGPVCPALSFGCSIFTAGGVALQGETLKDGVTPTNYFFRRKSVKVTGKYYFVRGILYGVGRNLNKVERSTNFYTLSGGIRDDWNIKLPDTAAYITPIITLDNTLSGPINGNFLVDQIKINPLTTESGIGGFLGQTNLILSWLRNSSKYNTVQVDEIIRKYLIPYDSAIMTTYYEDIDASDSLSLSI